MDDADGVTFLGARCPQNLRLRTVVIRDALDYRPEDWVDTLVVVECGALEVQCRSGARARFGPGSVLVLDGLALQRLRNASEEPLVLSALSRDPASR